MVLLTTFLLITVLMILGAAFVVMSSNEARISESQRKVAQAFNIAEAGIERMIYNLKEDFDVCETEGLHIASSDNRVSKVKTFTFFKKANEDICFF